MLDEHFGIGSLHSNDLTEFCSSVLKTQHACHVRGRMLLTVTGVVELMAGGAVVLAHNSGGPKLDIVKNISDEPVGYLANDVTSYAETMKKIFDFTAENMKRIQENARDSVKRFSHENFEQTFLADISSML